MASHGPNNPATAVIDASYGDSSTQWFNPNDCFTSNNVSTYINSSGSFSPIAGKYLKATNFGFSIPSGVTITGIIVEIERKTNTEVGYQAKDSRVRIVKGGTIQTTDLADTSTVWPTTDTYKTYGTSSELWGTSWTHTDINASTFGVVISPLLTFYPGKITCYAHIDHIRITVHYTEGGSARSSMIITG